jgi:hypothetical protein
MSLRLLLASSICAACVIAMFTLQLGKEASASSGLVVDTLTRDSGEEPASDIDSESDRLITDGVELAAVLVDRG